MLLLWPDFVGGTSESEYLDNAGRSKGQRDRWSANCGQTTSPLSIRDTESDSRHKPCRSADTMETEVGQSPEQIEKFLQHVTALENDVLMRLAQAETKVKEDLHILKRGATTWQSEVISKPGLKNVERMQSVSFETTTWSCGYKAGSKLSLGVAFPFCVCRRFLFRRGNI
jgi:hypothetical protein